MSTGNELTLGQLLLRERLNRKMTRKEVAEEMKWPAGTLEHWEQDRTFPLERDWAAICQFLHMPFEEVIPGRRPRRAGRPGHTGTYQRVCDVPITSPFLKQGPQPTRDYFQRTFFGEVCRVIHEARETRRGGLILIGPMLVGKTRMALEALKVEAPMFLLLLWSSMIQHPADLDALKGKDVAWLLDDIHELRQTNEVWQTMETLDRLQSSTRRLVVVATCRPGEEEQEVKKRSTYNPFIEYLNLLELRLQPMIPAEGDWQHFLAFAEDQVRQKAIPAFERQFFDGTPGSALLGLKRRTETIWDLSDHAQAILKAMALLRKARIYAFSESRLRRVAEQVFDLPREAWPRASTLLHETGWVRIGPGDMIGESQLFLPVDAYLDVCLVQSGSYPGGGRRIEDDFPALANALGSQRPDADALFKLSEALLIDRGGKAWAEWNELAWECARQGLAVLDPDRERELWADGHYVLGIAFWRRWQGQEQENTQQGIAALNAALQVFTREGTPTRWAAVHKWLGNLYRYLLRGGRQHNLDQALTHYQQALEVFTLETNPLEWANIQYIRGLTCLRRTRDGRKANLEQAMHYAREAMTIFTRTEYPAEWARTLMLLAEAALAEPYAQSVEHQQEAIVYLEQALEVRTRELFPYDWALTQIMLSTAYRLLQSGDPATNIELALSCLRAAMETLGAGYERDRSHALAEFGQTYVARILGERKANLARAQACYEEALDIQRRLGLRYRPETAYNKALLHEILAQDIQVNGKGSDAVSERQIALGLLREALEVYTAEDYPEEYTRILGAVTRIEEAMHFRMPDGFENAPTF